MGETCCVNEFQNSVLRPSCGMMANLRGQLNIPQKRMPTGEEPQLDWLVAIFCVVFLIVIGIMRVYCGC